MPIPTLKQVTEVLRHERNSLSPDDDARVSLAIYSPDDWGLDESFGPGVPDGFEVITRGMSAAKLRAVARRLRRAALLDALHGAADALIRNSGIEAPSRMGGPTDCCLVAIEDLDWLRTLSRALER